MKTFIRKLLLSENDWDLAINMADMWHLGLGKKVCLYDVTDIVVQKISPLRHDYINFTYENGWKNKGQF